MRKIKKKGLKAQLKPYLKELPENCKQLVGEGYVLYPVSGDGACGPRCLAAWIFLDPTLGPYLARNINIHFVKNWNYWKDYFQFPFEREVGNGRMIKCENENELFDFLLNSDEGAFMWRGHEDFSVICSAYQFEAKVITITGEEDENPRVNIIKPNPELANLSKLPTGWIPEMVILHEENSHYNLIIPRNSKLALEGGLDYQRNEQNKKVNSGKQKINQNESKEIYEKKVLEAKIVELESKCDKLETENESLIEKLKLVEGSSKIHNTDELDDERVLLNYKNNGYQRQSPQVSFVNKSQEKGFDCEQCAHKLETKGLLIAHMKSHNSEYKCDNCENVFWTKTQLENHVKNNHKENEQKVTKQYNCNDCSFQGENSLELKRHIQITMHTPCEYMEECFTCNKEFSSYWLLMNHRKADHPSVKKCRYFLNGECKFNAETCWYKHEVNLKPEVRKELVKFPCKECDKCFEHRSQLMKHKKENHLERISKCREFLQGNCNLDEDSCWFGHNTEQKENEKMETDEDINDQVFCEALEKTPPDQMKNILLMLNKLSVQVEHLEKMSKKIH